jgi:hypothetical protein
LTPTIEFSSGFNTAYALLRIMRDPKTLRAILAEKQTGTFKAGWTSCLDAAENKLTAGVLYSLKNSLLTDEMHKNMLQWSQNEKQD